LTDSGDDSTDLFLFFIFKKSSLSRGSVSAAMTAKETLDFVSSICVNTVGKKKNHDGGAEAHTQVQFHSHAVPSFVRPFFFRVLFSFFFFEVDAQNPPKGFSSYFRDLTRKRRNIGLSLFLSSLEFLF
jgi:hypothetical protein